MLGYLLFSISLYESHYCFKQRQTSRWVRIRTIKMIQTGIRESFDRLTQDSRASPDRKHEMISVLLWAEMFLRSINGNLDRQGLISDTEQ